MFVAWKTFHKKIYQMFFIAVLFVYWNIYIHTVNIFPNDLSRFDQQLELYILIYTVTATNLWKRKLQLFLPTENKVVPFFTWLLAFVLSSYQLLMATIVGFLVNMEPYMLPVNYLCKKLYHRFVRGGPNYASSNVSTFGKRFILEIYNILSMKVKNITESVEFSRNTGYDVLVSGHKN